MVSLLARAGMTVASSGTTSPLTLGNALGAVAPNLCSFMDFVTAGAVDGKTYRYLILDSNGNWEIGKGVYTASGTTLARNVQFSSNGNAAIAMTSSAQIFVAPIQDDLISVTDDQTALFNQTEKAQARLNVGAAPIEALAGNVLNINSGAEVSQENGTSAVTLTATSSLQTKYIVDGVMAAYRGTFVATAQQVTDAPNGFKNAVKFTVGTAQSSMGANDELGVLIPVEGVRCTKLAFGAAGANVLAVWFWVKAHRTGDYSGSLRNSAKTRSYPFKFTVLVSDMWEYKSLIIAGDTTGTWLTDSNVGLYLNICIAGGSSRVGSGGWAGADYSGLTSTTNGVASTSDAFSISGVGTLPLVAGVTVGDLPDALHSPFIALDYEAALPACQKYYWKTFARSRNPAQATNDFSGAIQVRGPFPFPAIKVTFPVTMCAAPAITFFNPKNANTNWYNQDTGADSGPSAAQNVSEGGFVALVGGTVAGDVSWNGFNVHAVANARL